MVIRLTSTNRNAETPQTRYPASPFRMFEDFFNDWALRTSQSSSAETWRPAVDILEKNNKFVLRAEIPGLTEKDIDLRLEGSLLTIRGERKPDPESEGYNYHQVESFYGAFTRSFTLPDTVDSGSIDANYKNGILTITIPQKPEVKPRAIKVNA